MITVPGVYTIPSEEYHADPCPTPSLSAGMVNDILIAPAKCRENSRRLNPNYEEPAVDGKFTIGSVSHVIFLESHEFADKVLVVDALDWRTKAAKESRDDAHKHGMTAILAHQMEKVRSARGAFLANKFVAGAFENGKTEQSMFWRHPRHGFWCRARPDFLADARTHLNDYKATANANPEDFGRHAYNLGYHRRAAWYLEGSEILFGTRPDHYWFINQEVKPPYLPAVVELDMQSIEAGQAENDAAAATFARCLGTGDWYGYRDPAHLDTDRAFRVGLPTYSFMQIDQRLGRDNRAWPARPPQEIPQYEEEESE